jgi:flavodoxin
MTIRVVFHSQTGNTRKVAEAIAEELGVRAEEISGVSGLSGVDLLFIGDGIYAQKIHKSTDDFISGLDGQSVKHAAVFGTYGGMRQGLAEMQRKLRARGIRVFDESFGCRGRAWLLFNRRHPSDDELAASRKFADRIKTELLTSS